MPPSARLPGRLAPTRVFWKLCSKHVSCEFDNFRVDTLCKLRDTPSWLLCSPRRIWEVFALVKTHGVRPMLPLVPLLIVTVYVCGWCTAGDGTTTTFSRPIQQPNMVGAHTGYTKHTDIQKAVALLIIRMLMSPLFDF